MKNKNKFIKISIQNLLKVLAIVLVSSFAVSTVVRAGSLTPSSSPASTMWTILEMTAKDVNNTFDRTTDSLEAISDSISGLISGIWNKSVSELTTVDSVGKLIVDNLNTTISSRASSDTALSTTTWTDTRAGYLDFLNSDLRFLVSSSTSSTTPVEGSIAYNIGSSSVATSTDTIFGWFKRLWDKVPSSDTALSTTTWTDERAGHLDAISQTGYSSTTITANSDGNILERLEYLENRSMFSVVNQKNGTAGTSVLDYAFYTQAKGGVDDYNNNTTMPTDTFSASWTQCTSANNYCKTGDSTACAGDVCYQDNSTGLIWSDWLDGGANHTWFWVNNCWEPGTWANPGACSATGDDACQCVTATSTPNITGCKLLGDGNWRAPYQKELMQAYIDGSWGNLPHAANSYWSATTQSNATQNAWNTALNYGATGTYAKTLASDSRCVR